MRVSSSARTRIFRLLALTMGLGFGLIMVELGIRVYVAASFGASLDDLYPEIPTDPSAPLALGDMYVRHPNPRVVYQMKPGLRGQLLGALVETNSLGLRDDEVTIERPERSLRVLALGDSTLFGWRVEKSETYLDLLEAQFARLMGEAWSVEFINAGVPGYMAVQEVERFRVDLRKFQPDAVLIQYDLNDAYPGSFGWRRKVLSARAPLIAHAVRGFARKGGRWIDDMRRLAEQGVIQSEPTDEFRPLVGGEELIGAYRRLRDACREMGVPLLVVLPAHRILPADSEIKTLEEHAWILGVLTRLECLTVDTFGLTQSYGARHNLTSKDLAINYPFDVHANPLRHALMAQAIYPVLLEALAPGRIDEAALESERGRAEYAILDARGE